MKDNLDLFFDLDKLKDFRVEKDYVWDVNGSDRMKGKLLTVHYDKAYGFIRGEDGREYFFHRDGLVNKPDWEECTKDRLCTFEPTNGAKGLRAENVMVL